MVSTALGKSPDPGAAPRVAVVIVSYESAEVLPTCLLALQRATDGVDLVSVVLADNSSTDASIVVAQECFPGIQVLRTGGNLGYAAALNRGRVASSPHDALLVLNADVAMEPGSLGALAEALGPEHGMSVPRMTTLEGSLSFSLRQWPTLTTATAEAIMGGRRAARLGIGEVVADPALYSKPGPVEWATGAAVMISSPCWEKLGDWDESFFLYSEETEYMLRARQMGIGVQFVPHAACRHKGGESGTSPDLWALLMANKVNLFRRSHGRVHTGLFRAALLSGQLIRAVAGDKTAAAAVRSLSARVRVG